MDALESTDTLNNIELKDEEGVTVEHNITNRQNNENEIIDTDMNMEVPMALHHESGKQHRAKAFVLDPETNNWDEVAIGLCLPDPSDDGGVFSIKLVSEEDSTVVLYTATFHKDQEVSIQNDTVLTWRGAEGVEAALSFESSEGCEEFLRIICRFQGRPEDFIPTMIRTGEEELEVNNNGNGNGNEIGFDDEFENRGPMSQTTPVNTVEITFPERPDVTNLPEVEDALQKSLTLPTLRRKIAQVLLEYDYLLRLLELFDLCEDEGMVSDLHRLYRIFKWIFLLNNQEIVRELLREEHFLAVAGVFEYDPALEGKRTHHRQYLTDKSRFKQLIKFNDPEVVKLIHQTFRAQYFKDVILARVLDEESFTSFMLLIRMNHLAIINAIDNDAEAAEVMKTLLQAKDMRVEDQLELLKFFKEFLSIAKTVTLRRGLQVYQPTMVGEFLKFIHGILSANTTETSEKQFDLRLLSVELLINFVQHDAGVVRNLLIHQRSTSGCNLMATIINIFVDERTESSIRWQLVSVVRILLDTFNPVAGSFPNTPQTANNINNNNNNANNNNGTMAMMTPQSISQALSMKSVEDFLGFFYPDYASKLLQPIMDLDRKFLGRESNSMTPFSPAYGEMLFLLSELLCNFITQHKYRIKYLVLRQMIVQSALLLLNCREKYLRLIPIRILRTILGASDEFYVRFLIQNRCLAPLFTAYRQNGGIKVNNLVSSAILDVFEFIRTSKPVCQDLVKHLATFHKSDLESLQPKSVFTGLLELHDRLERGLNAVNFSEGESVLGEEVDNLHASRDMNDSLIDENGKMGLVDDWMRADRADEEDYFSSVGEDDEGETEDFDGEPVDIELGDEVNNSDNESESDDEGEFKPPPLIGHDENEDEQEFPFLASTTTIINANAVTPTGNSSPLKKLRL